MVAAVLLLGVSACGGDDDAPDAPPPPGEGTELTVTLYPQGPEGRPPTSDQVTCPPDVTAATAACGAVAELPQDAADPVPAGAVCTQIYGGPDLVRLEGILRGSEVDTELTRENGCEIDRFARFLPLLRALFPGYTPGESIEP
jgi:hypothetical protein